MKPTAKEVLFGLTVGTKDTGNTAKEFGVDFYDLHFNGKEESLPQALAECRAGGTAYQLNFEGAAIGWKPSPALKQALAEDENFLGFLLDEADHMQINAHWPVIDYYGYEDCHYLAETEGLPLMQAQALVAEALRQYALACRVEEKPAAVEHLFPVMMHTVAKAGLQVAPKILKETCGPVMLAAAMGAARQYDVDFKICVDYWWHNEVIGHSAERFRSALLLAYWSGANHIYVEGGAKYSNNHPVGNEILQTYKDFLADYVPAHPRPYSWRDFTPEIGIIRFDDTCFDIRQRYLGEYPGPLYGHVPTEEVNTEWLNLWSLLSHGFVRSDSASHQWEARRFGSRTLFVPLHNTAVYDHEVGYETLRGLKLIFLSGVKISPQTYEAVIRLVREGAVCVLPPRLAPPSSQMEQCAEITQVADGAGRWLVVPEFYRMHYECFRGGPALPELAQVLNPLTGDGDHLVYQFGPYQARFAQQGGDYPRHEIMDGHIPLTQAGTNPDVLEVEIRQASGQA